MGADFLLLRESEDIWDPVNINFEKQRSGGWICSMSGLV